jgi:hypothetical protein
VADFKQTMAEEIRRREAELQDLKDAYRKVFGNEGAAPSVSSLNLNDLTVTDAIRELLEHAWEGGRQEMTIGEIEDTLGRFKVLTSRSGRLFSEIKHPLRQITIIISRNSRLFHLEMRGTQANRNDVVKLVKPTARKLRPKN